MGSFASACAGPAADRRIARTPDRATPATARAKAAPTAVGRELVPLVKRMLDEFDTSLFSVRELGRRQSVVVTIACLPTAAFRFLPRVIKRFNEQYP